MKSTQAEVKRRVEFCLRLRLQGAEWYDIRDTVRVDGEPWPAGHGKAWGVSESQIFRYLKLADKLLAETLEKRRDVCLDRHIAQRRMLYNRCLSTGDNRGALATLDSEVKLLGLGAEHKPASETQDGLDLSDLSLEHLRAIEAVFLAARGTVLVRPPGAGHEGAADGVGPAVPTALPVPPAGPVPPGTV
jgi:hypothetical protein